jgi:hypothetical protein
LLARSIAWRLKTCAPPIRRWIPALAIAANPLRDDARARLCVIEFFLVMSELFLWRQRLEPG